MGIAVTSAATRRALPAGLALAATLAAVATAAGAPVSTVAPSMQGHIRFNERIPCQPGQWEGNPVSFSYEWLSGGSPFATGQRILFNDTYSMGGYQLACRVTATDAEGQSASATSAAVTPGLGRLTLTITKVQVLPKGRVRISGVAGPPAWAAGSWRRDAFVNLSRVQKPGLKSISPQAKINAKGKFTVTGTDVPGRRQVIISFWSGQRDIWGGIEVTRMVRFTKGAGGGGDGAISIG
ncbi:MAG TPA: hypothetical protein PKE32_06800 [Miltoncostaeaceae bacterium]|nr:hypothetical protein [Miltoncostaeaceae bacterium]